jgi:hypothetical protein
MNYMEFNAFLRRYNGGPINQQFLREQWAILMDAKRIGIAAFNADAHDATIIYWQQHN